jgi:hypothetical protein
VDTPAGGRQTDTPAGAMLLYRGGMHACSRYGRAGRLWGLFGLAACSDPPVVPSGPLGVSPDPPAVPSGPRGVSVPSGPCAVPPYSSAGAPGVSWVLQ